MGLSEWKKEERVRIMTNDINIRCELEDSAEYEDIC